MGQIWKFGGGGVGWGPWELEGLVGIWKGLTGGVGVVNLLGSTVINLLGYF
jgi:hypothetical protein